MKIQSSHLKVATMVVMGLLLLSAIGFVLRRAGPLAPVKVTVVQATQGSLAPALFGIGTVQARRSYAVGPTAAGRVLRVLVDVGDSVKAGQVLAEMDPVDLDSRLAALDATVARAHSTIAAAQAQTVDVGARQELAAITARRYTDLGQQNFVSSTAVEAKVQEQTSAQAAATAAQANLGAASQDLVRLKAERAALAQQRGNVLLRASQDAVVIARDVEPGATVVAGQAVLKLVDPASLWVSTRFDQARSGGLAVGLPATVVLRSGGAQVFAGKVARVELQADSVTEERIAHIALDALPPGLALGELSEVTVSLPTTAPSVLIPQAAVKRRAGQTGVWVQGADGLRFASVRVGTSSLQGQVQVLDGLQVGDSVVVYSEKEIDAKTRISVVPSL